MRYIANNEQLIERLAESNLMRRAAQMTVYLTLKWKNIGETSLQSLKNSSTIKNFDLEKMQSFGKRLSDEIKIGLEEFKKNKPR